MSLFNVSSASQGAKKNTTLALNHVKLALDHVLQILRDAIRSGEGINRGDLRSSMVLFSTPVQDDHEHAAARRDMWKTVGKDTGHRSYKQVQMAGYPLFTVGDDKQELELEDSESSFEGLDDLLVSSTDGPIMVSLELGTSTAVQADDVGCSASCTVFWDQDTSTPILTRTLDKVIALLDSRLTPGYDTSAFHDTKDLVKDVLAAVKANDDSDNGLSLTTLRVSLCHTVRSLTSIHDNDEADTGFTGPLRKGDIVGVVFRAVATLSDGQGYHIGFERIGRVEGVPVFYYPAYLIVNLLRTETLSTWLATSMMLDLSSSGLKLGKEDWARNNVHYDPTVPAPPGYGGVRGLSNEVKDRISEVDEVIRQAYEVALGFDRMTTAALVNHSREKNSVVGPDLSFIAVDLLGRLFKRVKHNASLRIAFAKHSVRYRYSNAQMSSWKKRMLTGFSRRAGKWDETTDGPALAQAVFRMCNLFKVNPSEVCGMIVSGREAVAPMSLDLGSKTLLRREFYEPKSTMASLFFGVLSRRVTLWDYRDLSSKPLRYLNNDIRVMIKKNVDVLVPQGRKEKIRVDIYRHQVIIKSVLNKAAKSMKPPFATLGIKQDDWAKWDSLYSRSGGSGSATHDPVHKAIYPSLLKAFPNAPIFTRLRGRRMVHAFLDITIADKALKSLGRLDSAGRMPSRADICAYAVLMYMLRIDPSDDRFYETKLPSEYVDIFRLCVPHQRHNQDYIFHDLRSSLTDAYQAIDTMDEETRSAAFSTLLSDADLALVLRFRERVDEQ